MKFVIASDIHGSAYWTERLMEVIDRDWPDRVLLLGDLLYHGPRNDLPRDYAPKRAVSYTHLDVYKRQRSRRRRDELRRRLCHNTTTRA